MPNKSKVVWWVMKQAGDDMVHTLYRGPDKKRARVVAEKALQTDGKAGIHVAKLSSLTTLVPADLKASLPRQSF